MNTTIVEPFLKCFKLTDKYGKTHSNTQWAENVTHSVDALCNDDNLCTSSWIHFYVDPLIAVLMNPKHASFNNPILWEAEASGVIKHEQLKSGCKTLKTIRQIPLPVISNNQKIAFGILSALEVCKEPPFVNWANKWLDGSDRSKESAASYAAAADASASYAAAAAAASYASYADAYYASYADAASYASYADAAYYASYAAAAAAEINKTINFIALTKKAMTYE